MGQCRHRRRGQHVVAFAVIPVATMLLASCWDSTTPVMSADEIAHRLSIAARQRPPVYFVGTNYAGLPLTSIDNGTSRTWMYYGTCKYVDGSCDLPLEVETEPFHRGQWSGIVVDCYRLPDVDGVPAVSFGGDQVALFIGPVTVTVYGDPARRIAAGVRAVGGLSSAPLPRPSAPTVRVVERACGPVGPPDYPG